MPIFQKSLSCPQVSYCPVDFQGQLSGTVVSFHLPSQASGGVAVLEMWSGVWGQGKGNGNGKTTSEEWEARKREGIVDLRQHLLHVLFWGKDQALWWEQGKARASLLCSFRKQVMYICQLLQSIPSALTPFCLGPKRGLWGKWAAQLQH